MRFPVEIMITNKKLSYRDMITPGDIPEPHESVESFEGYMNVKGKRLTIDYKEYFGAAIELNSIRIKPCIVKMLFAFDL